MGRYAVGLILLAFPMAGQAQDLVLRKVTLSASGVAQFEYGATLDGAGRLRLDLPLDQVSDVLKSLRVVDPAGGLPVVSLAGRQPLSEAFRTLPFGKDALASPEALLGALVGAAVRLPASGVSGRILSVSEFEQRMPNDGGTQTRHRLTIATDTGLEMAVLEELAAVELTDPALRGQVGRALSATAANAAQDRRQLDLSLGGTGRRDVSLSYVVAAPAWKVSYRLELPRDPAKPAPARLQAFAVAENLSGQDWRDVSLVLTSGQPVLYSQALYDPVQPDRPSLPVDVPGRPTPQVDAGTTGALASPLGSAAADGFPRRLREARRAAPVPAPALVPPAAELASDELPPPPPPPPADAAQAATQVEYRLAASVTAASGQSLLLPVLDRALPGRRVALYQPATDRLHPLVALELRNDTGAALPAGLAALSDANGTFIGDARLPTLLPDETRLTTFAVDLAIRVDMTADSGSQVVGARVAGGLLEVQQRDRRTTSYRIVNGADSDRSIMVEQPRLNGWTLAEPASAATTPTALRISRDVAAGQTDTLRVVLERVRSERIALLERDGDELLAYADRQELSPGLRSAIRRAATLYQDVDSRKQAAADTQARIEAVVADQARVRANLGAVPANSELQRNYLRQLQQQEGDLTDLRSRTNTERTAVRDAEAALRSYITSLSIRG